jgi:EAL domain-containing protein (putative c-di-GMP-specific phosphodiesterase class I)
LRWTHPALGYVAPDVLLPVAQQIGLMPRLGRWVLAQALEHGRTLSDAAGRPVTISVNVAAEQLGDEEFLTGAEAMCDESGVHLVVELTERALVEDAFADEALRRLHRAGAGIAIDDFGVGYSSISYLHRFDCIDIVKIDRSFVQSVATDQRTRALVDSIIAMAAAFDAVVVAEGIEDAATCTALRSAGCRFGQGYFFRPAVPVREAVAFMSDGAPAFSHVVEWLR